jgi:hypothetical protein
VKNCVSGKRREKGENEVLLCPLFPLLPPLLRLFVRRLVTVTTENGRRVGGPAVRVAERNQEVSKREMGEEKKALIYRVEIGLISEACLRSEKLAHVLGKRGNRKTRRIPNLQSALNQREKTQPPPTARSERCEGGAAFHRRADEQDRD